MTVQTSTVWNRNQSLGEEIANSISHGIGLIAALAVTPILIINSIGNGAAAITSVCIFSATMVILYFTSMLYHALPTGKPKRVFQILDHSAIFLLIAGTYTPFTLIALPNAWGWTLFGMVWGLAALGVVIKSINTNGTSRLSIVLYLAMGWMALLAIKPLFDSMSFWSLFWLFSGGVMYSLGVIFFATDHRVRYHHFVWHLFVLAGTACHIIAIFNLTA